MTSATQTSPMSAWLIGLFLGVIGGFLLLELGFIGMLYAFLCLGLIAWKGPRLAATAGLATGVGLFWTIVFLNVLTRCAIENATPGSGCEAPGIGGWVATGTAVLLLGAAGTVAAARRVRGSGRSR